MKTAALLLLLFTLAMGQVTTLPNEEFMFAIKTAYACGLVDGAVQSLLAQGQHRAAEEALKLVDQRICDATRELLKRGAR